MRKKIMLVVLMGLGLSFEGFSQNQKHEAVDLGLSVKWAKCNVGANTPEEYGDYFARGETTTKDTYTDDNNVWKKLSADYLLKDFDKEKFLSKGTLDSNGNLTAKYDAASVNWGGSWRLPTINELMELREKCTWKWTTLNGVNGYEVTGPNNNSIFIPAAGIRVGSELNYSGTMGTYWTSSTFDDFIFGVFFYIKPTYYYWNNTDRSDGFSVRAVTE